MSGLAISFVAPSAYMLGGVPSWLDQLVPDLRRMGWRVQVVLADGHHHDARAYERAHPAIAPALHVRSATGTAESRVQALTVALETTPAGLVVSVNMPDALTAVARLNAAGRGGERRAVMSVHGLEPDLFRDMALFAPLLDGVICSNRLARTVAARTHGLEERRVLYAPYGTVLAKREPAQPTTTAKLTIGFAGRFERFQKRVQDLAPIASALARRGVAARWLIAGDGPDRDEVAALAACCPGAVELLGQVAPPEMAARFYARCDVLLMPSEWETGPIVAWEAMARDVAVVSSHYVGSGQEGALRDGENCLLFDVGDVEGAAACLARAAAAPLRARLCAAARSLVATCYSPEASAHAWAGALETIAAMPPVCGPEPVLPVAGRLDRWLGRGLAERVRRGAHRRYAHVEPGGEWPHAYRHGRREDDAHWTALRALDAAPARGAAAR